MNAIVPVENREPAPPEPFQFRIRDLLLVMLLVGLIAALIVERHPLLLLPLFGVGVLCLILWHKLWMPATLLQAVGLIGALCLLGFWMLPSLGPDRESSRRIVCGNNVKNIVLALHNYHDMHDVLPPTYIADASGRPMHSWRVLILPYMGRKDLYDQYRFDEPWNGPNNSQLADQIDRTYSCPADHLKRDDPQRVETSYLAVIGPHTAWRGDQALDLSVFSDGTSRVIMIVEVHNSGIHWMEPRDLHVDQMAPTINAPHGQGISSAHPGGAQVGMADGAVKFVPEKTPANVLRSRLQIDDGTLPDPASSW